MLCLICILTVQTDRFLLFDCGESKCLCVRTDLFPAKACLQPTQLEQRDVCERMLNVRRRICVCKFWVCSHVTEDFRTK